MPASDDRLYFLLQRAAHRLRIDADRLCKDAAGITTAQLGALFAVRDDPGVTQQGLARVLGLRESAVTALVGRLDAAGLIARRPHPAEHRAVSLHLTTHGAAALESARPAIDGFNAALRARLGDADFLRTAAALALLAEEDPA
ncbi:DNA-binding MarR family transcriptional regulator [Actinocorallia herbida]|uniref:DNA-binding MarR family transcriptional regulator n=1 Tax=Actinocorallia herbida TaxID=58109 RepID=A0A3N1D005_9ACTN|nr:MarR family winged helix-turn-helix transcriptional regulator [Actinocorallia herbida]ROO86864.1 DNA-binding MarR family transcriptional regulator [Actinocorallia herbida]